VTLPPGALRSGGWLRGSGHVLRLAVAAVLIAILAACGQSEGDSIAAVALPTTSPPATVAPNPTGTAPPTTTPTQAPVATPVPSPTIPAPVTVTVTMTDSVGREVELPGGRLERIISLAPSATEILFAIGAGDRLVGIDDFSNYPAETADIPKLGSFSPDLERIVALEPDLVVGSTITSHEVIEQIESLGIPVLIVGSLDVRGVADSIILLSEAVGEEETAQALAAELLDRIDAVVVAVAGTERPRIFYEVDASDPNRPFTIGPGFFVDDLITLAGAENVFADADSPFPQVGLEAVIARDPELIILADAPFGTTVESVKARAGWDGIDAVVNDRFMAISQELSDQMSRPGPRIADALEAIAMFLHPEAFE